MENIHENARKYVPSIITNSITDANELRSNRQMLMQLHDKQLISTRTLLAAFFLDIDAEAKIMKDESFGPHSAESKALAAKYEEKRLNS